MTSGRAKPWVLAATILGSSMAFIDGSVVNVALPAMQSDLGTSVRAAQWVVNAYMLLLGALTLVGGAAGDRFGRRKIYLLGVVLFTAASVACGLAPSAAVLVGARVVQGIGGAFLVPSSLALISASFPERERGRAIGTWAGASALTTAFGPVLGGWLVDSWSWRMIFFVNVPLAIATMVITFWRVPESRDETDRAAVDWLGGLLATAGFGAAAYGLTASSELGWADAWVLGSLAAGIAILIGFVWHEGRAEAPMMPLGLFRSPSFSGANAMTLLLYFALSGALFFLPFNLIRVHHYTAAEAGAAFLPFTLVMGTLSRWSGGLIARYGARPPLILGPLIVAVGFALTALPGVGGSFWATFFPATLVLGLGMAVSVAPLTTTVMSAVSSQHAGTASGINNATARLAGMLAVALLGAVAIGMFRAALDSRLDAVGLSPALRHAVLEGAGKLSAQLPPGIEAAQRQATMRIIDESFVRTFRVMMLIAAALAATSALCAALTIGRDRPRPVRAG